MFCVILALFKTVFKTVPNCGAINRLKVNVGGVQSELAHYMADGGQHTKLFVIDGHLDLVTCLSNFNCMSVCVARYMWSSAIKH